VNAKEVVRQIFDDSDSELAVELAAEIGRDLPTPLCRSRPDASAARSRSERPRSSLASPARQQRPHPAAALASPFSYAQGGADQAGRVWTRELPTPPSPLPAQHRQARLEPPTRD
jgi:hypothetical protein